MRIGAHLGAAELDEEEVSMDIPTLDTAALLDVLPAGVVVHGPDTQILYANSTALKVLRLTKEQILGKAALDPHWRLVDAFKKPLPQGAYPVNLALANEEPIKDYVIGVVDSSNDNVTWVLVNAYQECNPDGVIQLVVLSFIDISSQHDDLPFGTIVALANDIVVITTADVDEPRIVYVNQAFTRLTGYSASEAIGKTPKFLQRTETDPETRQRIRTALQEGVAVQETILNFHKDGSRYWLDMNIVPLLNHQGEISNFAAIQRDVTHLKEKEQSLMDLAERDSLTDLLNRRGFTDLSVRALAAAQIGSTTLGVGILDIDFFKKINDGYGHDAGDIALQHFATLMRSGFRAGDVTGRIGGEEFVVMFAGVDTGACLRALDNFREKVAASPVTLADGTVLEMTVSIGYSNLRPGDVSVQDVLKRADGALYEAKHAGRNQVCTA